MAATALEFVRIKNWRRARASDDRRAWAGYARDSDRESERRNGRASEAVALLPPPLVPSGALPDEMERAEWWLPLDAIEGTAVAFIIFSPAVVCILSATAAALPLFDKALDRRVMPMPPVLLGEAAALDL